VKKVLYNHPDYHCTLLSQQDFLEKISEFYSELCPVGDKQINEITIRIEGDNWRIFWPNREGEIFHSSRVFDTIKQHNVPDGLTISYPATASCRTLIFLEENGRGFAFLASPDDEGKVTDFRINAEDFKQISINIKGSSSTWYSLNFDTIEELEIRVRDLQASVSWARLPFKKTNSKWQVQVGLIGPDGKTEVPENRGFDVLSDISELMLRQLGENNILHIFGYSAGHDMAYPDYTPSPKLGGRSELKKAIRKIHQNNQKAVFYMNGRIAEAEIVERDGLTSSILTNNNGLAYVETYHGRDFYVMNPSSAEWQHRLLTEATGLKELGADGIQLDQLGGRAAPVKAGEIWGKGYINIIDNLQKEDLTIWIQGLSDIYSADWFELTYRDTNVLEDGTIRGGTPLGKSDKRIFQISVPNQVLLIPFSKLESKEDFKNNNIIVDLDRGMEELFLYTPSYIMQLEKLMSIAADSLVIDATAALR